LRTKSDQFKIFAACVLPDVVLNADARDAVIHLYHCRDADIFQQGSVPANRAHHTVELLQLEAPEFMNGAKDLRSVCVKVFH